MADTTLLNLTGADSGDMVHAASSVFFYTVLGDGTPVSISGTELRERISSPPGVLVRKTTVQPIRNDSALDIIEMDSPMFDADGWWDADSANILSSPSDKVEWARATYTFVYTGGSAGVRTCRFHYTDVTSTKYTAEYPLVGASSVHQSRGFQSDRRALSTNNAAHTIVSPPFYVESGDQFIMHGICNGNTPYMLKGFWSIDAVKLR